MTTIGGIVASQRGSLVGWVPVCLALGIGLYFSLPSEPLVQTLWALATGGVAALILCRFMGEAGAPMLAAFALVALGFGVAGLRAHQLAGPVLDWRYYGPIEGRVVGIDRSQSDALRLTLDQVVLERTSPSRTPVRVRVSLHGQAEAGVVPQPGLRVMTTGHLSPPGGPVEPGGFDFQRHAWFNQLGAVGYTRVPLLAIAAAEEGRAGLAIFRLRMTISEHVRRHLEGDIGGVAAALTTGDRSGISQTTLEALRASNLAHLLAISGLHMGLVSATVFGALRVLFALIPQIALCWPARSLAAGGALIASAGYLLLSGGNVATERAFVMVAVALVALMLNRRAISLRSVAIAATILLTFRPEALLSPGFQMSFAATTALVAVFGALRDSRIRLGPKLVQPAVALIISSAVAGAATAPIGAAHFNMISQYGLIANLLSVPLMGAFVVPAALLAGALSFFGMEVIGLWFMGQGLRWILGVAHLVAGWDGARLPVVSPDPGVLPLIALGALFVVIWQGRMRLLGVLPVLVAFWMWTQSSRPVILIADTGALMGVMTPQGRALSKPKGAGFVARNWLENDGEGIAQRKAAARWDLPRAAGLPQIRHVSGKKRIAGFEECTRGEIVVINGVLQTTPAGDCEIHDQKSLRLTGAIAFHWKEGVLVRETAKERAGIRLWNAW